MSKPFNPRCVFWHWIIVNGNIKVARCTHKKGTVICDKDKCPIGKYSATKLEEGKRK